MVSLNGLADLTTYRNLVFDEAIEASYSALGGSITEERNRRSATLHPERLSGLAIASATGGLDESLPPESVLELVENLQRQPTSAVLSIHRPQGGHETDYPDTVAALSFALASLEERTFALRGSYANSLRRFEASGHSRVAFMGGSITEMDGYRPIVCSWLQEKFMDTTFDYVKAGISSTCSTTGAFRLEVDVLSEGRWTSSSSSSP